MNTTPSRGAIKRIILEELYDDTDHIHNDQQSILDGSMAVDLDSWEIKYEEWLRTMEGGDAAHGISHFRRVVQNAKKLAGELDADMRVVVTAAWLHDCVNVPKDSPLRAQASRLSGKRAAEYLAAEGFDASLIPAVRHAIEAHSFSAKITPGTLEAQIVQDADRLDAIGAIGIARCLQTGSGMGRQLYDVDQPFPITRPAEDSVSTIDHFFTKLLTLGDTMQRRLVQRFQNLQSRKQSLRKRPQAEIM